MPVRPLFIYFDLLNEFTEKIEKLRRKIVSVGSKMKQISATEKAWDTFSIHLRQLTLSEADAAV